MAADDAGALDEDLARVVVDDQVEVAPAVARLDVGQAVELLGQRPQRLGQELPGGRPQRQLAAARPQHGALGADEVADVDVEQPLVGLLRRARRGGEELQVAGAVLDGQEGELAVLAPRHDAGPPRDRCRAPPRRTARRVVSARAASAISSRSSKRVGNAASPRSRMRGQLGDGARLYWSAPDRPLWASSGMPEGTLRPLDIDDLELASRPAARPPRRSRRGLWPRMALPTGDSLESLCSAGSASAEPTMEYCTTRRSYVLDGDLVPTPTTSVEMSLSSITIAMRSFSSRARCAPRASPARSWRRRTRSSRRCRRTREPP